MRVKETPAPESRAAVSIAVLDACVVVVVAFGVALADGKSPAEFVLRGTGILLAFVLPLAVGAGLWAWFDLRRFARGHDGLRRPALQAFALGFLPRPVSDAFGIVQEAVAAGPPWPSPGYSSAHDWLRYLVTVLLFATIMGIVAAVTAVAVALANRWLYGKLANKALKTDGRSAPAA